MIKIFGLVFFFFSSRRRHTRSGAMNLVPLVSNEPETAQHQVLFLSVGDTECAPINTTRRRRRSGYGLLWLTRCCRWNEIGSAAGLLAPRWDQLVSGVFWTRSVGPSLRENAQRISRKRQMTAPEGTDIEIAGVEATMDPCSIHNR